METVFSGRARLRFTSRVIAATTEYPYGRRSSASHGVGSPKSIEYSIDERRRYAPRTTGIRPILKPTILVTRATGQKVQRHDRRRIASHGILLCGRWCARQITAASASQGVRRASHSSAHLRISPICARPCRVRVPARLFLPTLERRTLRRAALFAASRAGCRGGSCGHLEPMGRLARTIRPRTPEKNGSATRCLIGCRTSTSSRSIPGFFADNYMAALDTMAHFGLMGLPLGAGLNARRRTKTLPASSSAR